MHVSIVLCDDAVECREVGKVVKYFVYEIAGSVVTEISTWGCTASIDQRLQLHQRLVSANRITRTLTLCTVTVTDICKIERVNKTFLSETRTPVHVLK